MCDINVWLVKLEEPQPIDDGYRSWRMDMLAQEVHASGGNVTRICSRFNHYKNVNRDNADSVYFNNGIRYVLLDGLVLRGNKNNIKRFISELVTCWNFIWWAKTQIRPDVLVVSMPSPEITFTSALLCKFYNIHYIIDCRDMWPDVLTYESQRGINIFLRFYRILINLMLYVSVNIADKITGINKKFVEHLLKYRLRKKNVPTSVFEIGYKRNNTKKFAPESAESSINKLVDKDFINSNDLLIYYAGRMNKAFEEMIPILAEAFERFDSHNKNVKIIFCGSGACSEKVTFLSKYSWLAFLGEQNDDVLQILQSRSLVGFQPIVSRIDYASSLSNKFFEYCSASLSILTSVGGITEDLVTKHQCGNSFKSSDELFNRLLEIQTNPGAVKDEGLRALNLFNTHFDSHVIYQNFSKFIKSNA